MKFAANVKSTKRLNTPDFLESVIQPIKGWANVEGVKNDGDCIRFTVEPHSDEVHLLTALGRVKDSFPGMVELCMKTV